MALMVAALMVDLDGGCPESGGLDSDILEGDGLGGGGLMVVFKPGNLKNFHLALIMVVYKKSLYCPSFHITLFLVVH